MFTKGSMIKALKSVGVRKGAKGDKTVKLEHLNYFEVCKLYDEYCK